MHGGIEIQTARRAVPGHPRNSKAKPSKKRHPKKIHIKIHTEFFVPYTGFGVILRNSRPGWPRVSHGGPAWCQNLPLAACVFYPHFS